MAKVWAAECKNQSCKKLSGVRPSKSEGATIDVLRPSELIQNLQCPYCGNFNDFFGTELKEVDAKILTPTG